MVNDIKTYSDGPAPGTRWLTADEFTAAQNLALQLAHGTRMEGVALWDDLDYPNWQLLELPCPDHPTHTIWIVLPIAGGSSGLATTGAFFLVVAPANRDEKGSYER